MSRQKQTAAQFLRAILTEAPRSRATADRLLREAGYDAPAVTTALADVDWQEEARRLMAAFPNAESKDPEWFRLAFAMVGFPAEEAETAMWSSPWAQGVPERLAGAASSLEMGQEVVRGVLQARGYDPDMIEAVLSQTAAASAEQIAGRYAGSSMSDAEILREVSNRGFQLETLQALERILPESAPQRAVARTKELSGQGQRRRQIRMGLREAGFPPQAVDQALRSLADAQGLADSLIDRYMEREAVSLSGLREALARAGIAPETSEKALVRRGLLATDWEQAAGPVIQAVVTRQKLARQQAPARLRELGHSDAQIDYAIGNVIDRERWALAEAEWTLQNAGGTDRLSLLQQLIESGHERAVAEAALEKTWVPHEHDPDAAVIMVRQAVFSGRSEEETRQRMRQLFDEQEIARAMSLEQPDWREAARRRLRRYLLLSATTGIGPVLAEQYLLQAFGPEVAHETVAGAVFDWTRTAHLAAERAFFQRRSAAWLDTALTVLGYSSEDRQAAQDYYRELQRQAADIRPA